MRNRISNCAKSSSPRFPKLELYPDEELQISPVSSSGLVCSRLRRLVSEFRSLPEPIDRVKRLLDYATVLPRLGESTRAPENRVPGCAAQVWLEVEMDEYGRMRFGADSDSEITKGFCSCLIYLLDGAYPEDVLKVKAEDLADMNVGLPVRSRVNSWHNVLINMRERTRSLAARREEMSHSDPLEAFPTLVIPADSIITKESKMSGICSP